jgi:indolepyruvate ferredoxin oxidoreductase, beta subunit
MTLPITEPITRPVTILIAALGGEGGGVLADWLIHAANEHDFPVQSTSIPGVAQRTGATTYYIEIFPLTRRQLAGRKPVFSLTPNPGDIDIAVASELVEGARIVINGFANPQRTTFIGSTHREYAVSEKVAMADGRFDSIKAIDALQVMARMCVLFDMREMAWRNGTVINTIMFGAMVGVGALPVSRAACEAAIHASGKAVEASLKGFATGHDAARASTPVQTNLSALPAALREVVEAGATLTADYQDARYAQQYRETVERMRTAELDAGGARGGFPVTREVARFLALWMSYEDVIRVADLKTRRARLARVRAEVSARPQDIVRLTEFLKPGQEEVLSVLPPRFAGWLANRGFFKKGMRNIGLHIRTDTVSGFAMLCALRGLRRWRRHTSRFQQEHRLIADWLARLQHLLAHPGMAEAALELALAGNLVKGYGQTHARGQKNLRIILAEIDARTRFPDAELATRIRRAREAALADPEGRQLAQTLGLPVPEPVAKPINFVRNRPAA